MNNKFIFILIGLMFLIPFVNAEVQTLGTFQQQQCISLVQTCANCSYVNVTTIKYPDGKLSNVNADMTKTGTVYNYTFCDTNQLGYYVYNTLGNPEGILVVAPVDFLITPSGSNNILGLFIMLIFISYGVTLWGAYARNVIMSLIGGMLMIIIGLYIVINGFDIYRNMATLGIGLFTIGMGAYWAIMAGIEMTDL